MGLIRTAYEALTRAMREKIEAPAQASIGGMVLAMPRFMQAALADYLVDKERFAVYDDAWRMYQESTLVQKTTDQFVWDACAEPPTLKCDDKEGLRIMHDFLERVEYYRKRSALLGRCALTGDVFVQRNLGNAYGRRTTKVWTETIDLLPEFTMFRNSSIYNRFVNHERAFFQQIPSVPFKVDQSAPKAWFPIYQVRHGRWNNEMQPYTKYGMSALAAARVDYNVLYRTMKYMAIARHSTAYNRRVWKLGTPEAPITTQEKIEEWKRNNIEGVSEDVLATYVVSGNIDVKEMDPRNSQLGNVEDVKMLMNIFKTGLLYPIELLGFGVGDMGVSEGELVQLEAVMKRSVGFAYSIEEYEILRPLLEFELALHNKFVPFDLVYKEYSVEDRNKRSKRLNSEVQVGRISLETAWNLQYREYGTWEEEEERILAERQKGLAAGGFVAPPETLEKGKKGVETKDTADQDIAGTYDTTDEE